MKTKSPKRKEKALPGVGSSGVVRAHRRTFLKAFEEERKGWRWAHLPNATEALVLAFCACIHLRMQGTSMDEVMRPNARTQPPPG